VVAAVLARGPLHDAYNLCDGETRWDRFVDTFAEALGRTFAWRRFGAHTLVTRTGDNAYQYLVTTGAFGAHFPTDKLMAALPGLTLADWRDGCTRRWRGSARRGADQARASWLQAHRRDAGEGVGGGGLEVEIVEVRDGHLRHLGGGERERAQEHLVDRAEDRRVCADAGPPGG